MIDEKLSDYLDAAREAARRGAAVLEHWRDSAGFRVKEKGRFDLVTEADVGSQQAIRSYLTERFPAHGFLGEEADATGKAPEVRPPDDAPPTWIVDPLDGTTNFVHDFPFYCVSIGLWADRELVVGVVYEPKRREMFSAARGIGAWLGERRLEPSQTDRLDQALLATGFPPDIRGHERALEWWEYFCRNAQSVRRTGSTALNLAYLAAGRFDGFWAFDNHVWDIAGGAVIVREAGGILSNADGSAYDPFTPDAVASNGPLQPALLNCFTSKK